MNQPSKHEETTHEVLCCISSSLYSIEERLESIADSLQIFTRLIEKASGTFNNGQYGFIRNAPLSD